MKREGEQKTCLEQTRGATKMNRLMRAFGSLTKSSANVSHNVTISAADERAEVAQTFQLEAEQKRALGIMYYRRDVGR